MVLGVGLVALSACGHPTSSAGGEGGAAPSMLEGVLQVTEAAPDGSSVTLSFTLANRSETEMVVLKWYTPLEGIFGEIFDVYRDGQPLPYEGPLVSRAVPTADDYVRLGPGESATALVDLADAYEISQTGRYTVSFRSPLISHVATTVEEMATSMDDLGPVDVSSNEVAFEVREGSDA
jgi:hypothetical protein